MVHERARAHPHPKAAPEKRTKPSGNLTPTHDAQPTPTKTFYIPFPTPLDLIAPSNAPPAGRSSRRRKKKTLFSG